MESSRIVGGRARTQAPLRAPDKTSRTVTTGACPPSGSRGVTQYYADNEIPLPSGSIRSPVPALKALNLSQAILDGLAVLFLFLFFAALIGSVPLAVGLLIFAKFH
jgi:hypothetical protein